MYKQFLSIGFVLLIIGGVSNKAFAQLSITAANTNFTIDFDNSVTTVNNSQFNGSGFTGMPAAGGLNSNAWAVTGFTDGDKAFGVDNTTGDYARGESIGKVATGGLYAFDVSNGGTKDVALGFQSTNDDFTPGTITLQVTNNTGSTLINLDISYDIYVYNNENRSSTLNFSHSSNNSTYTSIASGDFTTTETEDGSPTWVATSRTISLTGLSISDGASYYIRWESNDVGGSGSRDEIAIDNIVLNSCVSPNTQASGFATANESNTSIDISFTRGDGDGGVLVLARAGSAVDEDPVNGTTYTGNATFGSGTEIGTGNYVVYKDIANGTNAATGNITISGLSEATTYHFAVYEYNTTGICHDLTELTGNGTTLCTTPTDATDFSTSKGNTQSVLSWTNPTCFDEVLVIASTASVTGTPMSADGTHYTANTAYSSGLATQDFSAPEYPVYQGVGSSVTVTGLTNGTQYFFKIFTRKGTSWSAGTEVNVTPVDILFQENFDGSNTSITAVYSVGPEIGSTTDYYGVTSEANIAAEFTGEDNNFLAAQNTNGPDITSGNQSSNITISYDNIDITGASSLYLCVSVAEDDAADMAEDWNSNDEVFLETDIDNTGYEKIFQISDNNGNNTEPGLDTDCDGNQNGTAVTSTFTTYCVGIHGTGTSMDLRITLYGMTANDEDIALDNIEIYDGSATLPTSVTTFTCQGNLPVELASFTANSSKEGIRLYWQTLSEINNSHFEIQHSLDGKIFNTIGQVEGQGTTTMLNVYTFLDDNPSAGTNYYRLKQVDFDGKFEYSPIVSVNIETQFGKAKLFPNPTSGMLNVELPRNWQGETTIEIYDVAGRLVHSKVSNEIQNVMNLNDLHNGQYILRLMNANEVATKYIVKVN